MKQINYLTTVALVVGLVLCLAPELQAQRSAKYQKLSLADQRPSQFFDFLVLPGNTDETVTFASVYSFSYRYLPFKKLKQDGAAKNNNKKAFFSPVNLSMEVFNSSEAQLKKRDSDISVERLEPAERSFWEDTAYAETYEQTQTESMFLHGHIGMELKPGIYTYVLQMKRGERSDPRNSRTRTVRLDSYRDMEVGNVILGEELYTDQRGEKQLTLMSMGDNVKYGSDFRALAYIPGYDPSDSYTVNIRELNISGKDTSKGKEVFVEKLDNSKIQANLRPQLVSSGENENRLRLAREADGFTYALIEVPNSTFPNASYQLTIRDQNDTTVSRTTYRSMWIDMPRSLLSLDMAIDMLRYIVDEETLDSLSEGSQDERERKFRAFWKKKDPTPDTEYNELMAEYYRRIDYAYQNFSTSNRIGYESDQGEIYIKFGPPQNIERKFPPNGSTVEIWSYPNREFIFRATSGFGDFRLVSE
ncbi:GWxTD domain-containing protein [Fodinibius roseus]|uniref:GWxTD domain-containing protein n=1 Tax=Fodinibius roseus TaxID=1194090 RepID=A0A1M5C5T6_9BACT|nr:GWxTD domain-containing protein [Fodinibius roseus]SHF50071.1 GWxTD domain-containing protein [Fodinibius roseus]